MSHPSECGGYEKTKCTVYGVNGTKQPPSMEELNRAIRQYGWSEFSMKKDCAWFPFCTSKAWYCGGLRKQDCSNYGDKGSKHPPSEDMLCKAKRESNRRRAAFRRSLANPSQPSPPALVPTPAASTQPALAASLEDDTFTGAGTVHCTKLQVHGGPTSTAAQKVKAAVIAYDRCMWWPLCTTHPSECGGYYKKKCIIYGDGGTE